MQVLLKLNQAKEITVRAHFIESEPSEEYKYMKENIVEGALTIMGYFKVKGDASIFV